MSLPLVVAFPDPRLARQAAIVESFDEALQLDARLLLDSLRTIPAIGLAGPHLGIMRRIIAIDRSASRLSRPRISGIAGPRLALAAEWRLSPWKGGVP